MTRLGVICGGSGSSKFAISLGKYAREKYDLGFVCNVGDNFWFHGLYVCPDIDIITYALSGRLDESKGWGIANDSNRLMKGLKALGFNEWFNLGDEDMALSVVRTELLRKGHTLSQITNHVSKSLGIDFSIIPSTDDGVETHIFTSKGKLHLQEYWVKLRASPKVHGVDYVGIQKAVANSEAVKFLSETAIICPANPITSILPTLNIPGMRKILKQSKLIAVSPFIGKRVFSGPASKLMRGLGLEPSSFGVAKLYSGFIKKFLVDKSEESTEIERISSLGIECIKSNIRIKGPSDRKLVVGDILNAL